MKRVLLASALAVALTSPVFAQGPAGQSFALAEGDADARVEFDSAGAYTLTVEGETTTGVYTYEDGELCITSGEDETDTVCESWTDLEVGQSAQSVLWTEDGAAVTITRTA